MAFVPEDEAPGLWKLPFSRSELAALLAAMCRASGAPECGPEYDVELLPVSDAAMEALHAKSLGRAGPTNILSFPLGPGAAPAPVAARRLLGSLVLSTDTLLRECFFYGQDPREHCIRLLAHGLAHLMGHEHGEAMQTLTARMETAALALFADSAAG